jgi:hypothetical protein
MATRNASWMLRLNIVCLGADAALAIGLIPVLGLWGAVTANATAQLLSVALITAVAIRQVGIEGRAVAQACMPLVLGLIGAGVALALVFLVHFPLGLELIMALLSGLATIVAGLWLISSWRISATESSLVEVSLPVWLRSPYHWVARIFSIVESPVLDTHDS